MNVDFNKSKDGLVPAVIQDFKTNKVLMLGYMSKDSLSVTLSKKTIHFYSRSKNRIWKKGEESGNVLNLISTSLDCDNDTLLIKVKPTGPVCHKGSDTCWDEQNINDNFLYSLENVISDRKNSKDPDSYISDLFSKGLNKIAQKVGEEAVELVIESKDNNENLFLNESADLLFHYLILLQEKGFKLEDVVNVLKQRNNSKNTKK
jgi:phosphoribosyl-ATP pyrophosphohydrolase/phosphoribosyl-AMP cyclohydrolase